MRTVRLAFRKLLRTPVVTAVAVLSLALGIGANTAIFSLTYQVLLRSLPVPSPERLVDLSADGPRQGSMRCGVEGRCQNVFSYLMYEDLARGQTVLTGLAAHVAFSSNFAMRGQAFAGQGTLVSGSYFRTLGLRPALGRLLEPADDATAGTGDVAVLSYTFWHGRLGEDSSVVGQTIEVKGQPLTIVGVAPRGFEGTSLGAKPMLFAPLAMALPLGVLDPDDYTSRTSYSLYLFGRLKPGVTIAQARAALNGLYRPILNDVEAPLQEGLSAGQLQRFRAGTLGVTPGFRGQSMLHDVAGNAFPLLFVVTGIVLLIACANIANLLLAVGAGRAREMGARLALGATRRHLVGQLLTESVVLALLGGVASLVVASFTLQLLESLLPAPATGLIDFTLHPAVLLFAAVLAVGTGLLFGLFPALHNTRAELIEIVRGGAVQVTAHRGAARFRSTLVAGQIALASALLISAGLFLKSLVNVSRVQLGERVDGVVTFSLSPQASGYDSARTAALFQTVADGLGALPGVIGVSSSRVPLLFLNTTETGVHVAGRAEGPGVDNGTNTDAVGADYFRTLGIPVLAGREFTRSDALGAPRVAVVNQAFARKFGLGADPLHTYVSLSSSDSLNIEIVGLVKDAKHSSVTAPVPPLIFVPWYQDPNVGTLTFYVRTAVPPAQQLAAIPGLLRRVAPGVPVENLRTLPEEVRDGEFLNRLTGILSALFATLATLLAAVGLYGVTAYAVQQRTREIGIRMALGADPWGVRALVGRQTGLVIGVGGAVGVGLALAAGRLLQSLLYGLAGDDPAVFALALATLAAVALVATWAPVRRASRVDPVEALRAE